MEVPVLEEGSFRRPVVWDLFDPGDLLVGVGDRVEEDLIRTGHRRGRSGSRVGIVVRPGLSPPEPPTTSASWEGPARTFKGGLESSTTSGQRRLSRPKSWVSSSISSIPWAVVDSMILVSSARDASSGAEPEK